MLLLIEPPLQSRRHVVLALRAMTKAVLRKSRAETARNLKIVHKAIAVRQFAKAEREVTEALVPFFVEQGRSMVSRLRRLEKKSIEELQTKWDPSQPRDELGRFAPGGGGGGGREENLLYHGTSEEAADAILREGLQPSRGGGADEWAKREGWGVIQVEVGGKQASVFVTPSLRIAGTYANRARKLRGGDPVVLEIRIPEGRKLPFIQDEEEPAGLRLEGTIPPKWIKRHRMKAVMQGNEHIVYLVVTVPMKQEEEEKSVSFCKVSPDPAAKLASQIFHPDEWRSELTNRLLPVLALKMAEAGVAHLMTLGVDVRRKRTERKGLDGEKYNPNRDELGRFASGPGGGGRESGEQGESAGKEGSGLVTVFHGTKGELIDSILQNGILPAFPKAGSMGRYVGVSEQPAGVYFTRKRGDAANWGEFSARGYRGRSLPEGTEIAVFEARISKERILKDPMVSRARYATEKIEPRSLRSVAFYKVMSAGGLDFANPEIHEISGGEVKGQDEESVFIPVVLMTSEKSFSSLKATTASDWVEEHAADWASLIEAFAASGLPVGVLTEIPAWMQRSIAQRLSESFAEDYWDKISETMMGDAERVLRRGLAEGESIHGMARQLREYFEEGGFRYARRRSENIAMTESGNALNGARKDSVARLQAELGKKVPMKQTWLSVLSNTTRATHADLDGVPENKDGLWNLGGYMIPWPAHISLPPSERCNCQCTVSIEFGMDEDEAQRHIEEYWERVQAEEAKGLVWPWQKYDPGQPRDEQGRFGSGGGGGGRSPSRVERAKRTHKPSTAGKQRKAEAEQSRLAKDIGGQNTDDNDAFDVLVGNHAIEVKAVMDNNNDKITMHPESRKRKEAYARKNKIKSHTVAIDVRGGKRSYYHREGVGAFRLRNMEKVTIGQLIGIVGGG